MTDAASQPRQALCLVRSCALLSLVLLVAALPAGAWAFQRHAVAGLLSVAIAAVVTGLAANAALVAAGWWRHTPQAVSGLMMGTIIGLFVPLVCGLIIQSLSPMLREAGVMGWMVAFFLLALLVKTLLVVRLIGTPAPSAMQRSR